MNKLTIVIKQLKTECVVGVYDKERSKKRPIIIDLEIDLDTLAIEPAIKNDNIKETLDYDQISSAVVEYVEKSNFSLIETLANGIADIVLESAIANKVKVGLYKPGCLDKADGAAVIIEKTTHGK